MHTIETRPTLGGTDGFRGIATAESGAGQMNPETIAGLTAALIDHQRDNGADGPVVIAQDTRPSGAVLRSAAIAAAEQSGLPVIDLGIAPTPAAQKVADDTNALATVVLTASHNPWPYNGWKGMLGSRKPSKDETSAISQRYWTTVDNDTVTYDADLTRREPTHGETIDRYLDQVVTDIETQFGPAPLADRLFVIDGAYGAAQAMTPDVFRRLGADVVTFSCDGMGTINKGCGAADLSGLQAFLAHTKWASDRRFVGALANDGDADRVMGLGITEQGNTVEITGNHIMYAAAISPNQPGIVGTEYTNSAVKAALLSNGIAFEYCANGDVNVTNALRTKQGIAPPWQRGGEFTGHLIDTAWLGSGDGVRMAAWYAAYAATTGQTFGQLHAALPLWPEHMTTVSVDRSMPFDVHAPLVQAAIQTALRQEARPIVRASGTEPVVRIWCEAPDQATVTHAHSALIESVKHSLETAK